MKIAIKLATVLLLGSSLSACSMIGLGDNSGLFGGYSPQDQSGYAYGGATDCQPAATAYQPAPTAYQPVVTQPACPTLQAPTYRQAGYGQATQLRQSPQLQQPYNYPVDAAPAYSSTAPVYNSTAPVYAGAPAVPAYAGPSVFAGQQGLRGAAQGPQSNFYGTLGGILYDTNTDLYGIQGRLGWQSASFFGAEVEGSFGVASDNDDFDFGAGAVPSDISVDNQIAAFATARYPVGKKFDVFARYGYHRTDLSAEADVMGVEVEDDFTTDGIAYGAGVEYKFSPIASVRADYTRYDFDGPDTDSISLAIARKF